MEQQMDGTIDGLMDRWVEDGQIERDSEIERQRDRETERQRDRQTKQTRQTDRKAGRQTGRQIDSQIQTYQLETIQVLRVNIPQYTRYK